MDTFSCAILRAHDLALSAEEKYFLIRALYAYGCSAMSVSLKVLEKQMGLSEETLKKTRDSLERRGYLTKVLPDSKGRRGRPKGCYKISDHFQAELSKEKGEALPVCFGFIEQLFCTDYQKKSSNELNRLRPSTRVLLGVLYCHADVCGTVRGLGLLKLGKMAGMSCERLEDHEKILIQEGFIIYRVKGGTGKHLFGHAPGAFFLNRFKSGSTEALQRITLGLLYNENTTHYNDETLSGRLQAIAYPRKAPQETDAEANWEDRLNGIIAGIKDENRFSLIKGSQNEDGLENIISYYAEEDAFRWLTDFSDFDFSDFFKDDSFKRDSYTSSMLAYLQYKIEEYAAILLNRHSEQVYLLKVDVIEQVLSGIRSDIIPAAVRRRVDKVSSNSREKITVDAFVFVVYMLAYEHALFIKALACKIADGDVRRVTDIHFSVIPCLNPGMRARWLAVIMYSKRPLSSKAIRAVKVLRADSEDFSKVKIIDAGNVKELLSLDADLYSQFEFLPKLSVA